MSLTEFERLSLINQFEIRKKLENADDYDEVIEILLGGYEVRYAEVFRQLDPSMSEEDGSFVLDVLKMFRELQNYERDPNDPIKDDTNLEFGGFDGNNEGRLMAFARHEIQKIGHWDELKPLEKSTDGFNSHCPMRATYENMLRAYIGLGSERVKHQLTKVQVEKVLAGEPADFTAYTARPRRG